MDEPALAWLGIAALLCVAAAFTSLLRWAWPAGTAARSGFGCSILGGILAGIVLGPTILGRVLPAAYEGWVVGGTTERDERDRLMRTHGADEIAAAQANLPAEQLKAMRDQANRDVEAAMRTWREAQWEHQSAQRTLAALIAVRIELFDHFAIWPLIVILVVSDDGRWLGAFIGAMLLGRRKGLRTMRLVVGSMSAGLTQLAVTAVAAATWMIPHRLLMPLLLGSLLIEVTSRARRHFAAELRRMDEEADPDQGS